MSVEQSSDLAILGELWFLKYSNVDLSEYNLHPDVIKAIQQLMSNEYSNISAIASKNKVSIDDIITALRRIYNKSIIYISY